MTRAALKEYKGREPIMQSAINAIKEELRRVQQAEETCVDDYGIVKPCMRYRYQELVKRARELQGSINWLEQL